MGAGGGENRRRRGRIYYVRTNVTSADNMWFCEGKNRSGDKASDVFKELKMETQPWNKTDTGPLTEGAWGSASGAFLHQERQTNPHLTSDELSLGEIFSGEKYIWQDYYVCIWFPLHHSVTVFTVGGGGKSAWEQFVWFSHVFSFYNIPETETTVKLLNLDLRLWAVAPYTPLLTVVCKCSEAYLLSSDVIEVFPTLT